MKVEPKVIIVVLRRPKTKSDPRKDPIWEHGSFGCTGCHSTNLMNPRKGHELIGARLAFAQGGKEGFKLVYLTPEIDVIHWVKIANNKGNDLIEAKWKSNRSERMPFKYSDAPLLIDNNGEGEFEHLKDLLIRSIKVKDQKWVGKLSSKFRTRRKPLKATIAQEIIDVYDKFNTQVGRATIYSEAFTSTEEEALRYERFIPKRKSWYKKKKREHVRYHVKGKIDIHHPMKHGKKISECKKSCK